MNVIKYSILLPKGLLAFKVFFYKMCVCKKIYYEKQKVKS